MNKKIIFGAIGILIAIVIALSWPTSTEESVIYAKFDNVNESVSENISTIDVYFDASTSMKAYLVSDDGRFCGKISNLYRCADSINMYFLKTGNNIEPFKDRIANISNYISKFDGGDTQFDLLIPYLCQKSKRGKVCAFVTDGILYFNKNTFKGLDEFENTLAKAIGNEGNDKAFAIYNYSANFMGNNISKRICYFDMNDKPTILEEKNRPYYIIFIGTPKDIRRIKTLESELLNPEKALYFGIHDFSNHTKGKQFKPDTSPVLVNPNSPLTLSTTLPQCMSFLYDNYKSYFSVNNIKVYLTPIDGAAKKLSENEYTINVSKGTAVNLDIILAANPGRGQGQVKVVVENTIPYEWKVLSIENDSSIELHKDRTFGLENLINGIKLAADGPNTSLVTIYFDYRF